jgi:glutathione S-transferase
MTLKIYGIPKSRAFRNYWLCAELGIPYEDVKTGFTDDVKTPAYLAINPNGRVPAIDDDGFRLFESFAINLYLAKKHGLGKIYPADLHGEAKCWQWTIWGVTELEKLLFDLTVNRAIRPPGERDAKVADAAEASLVRPLSVLDNELAARPWILGGEFSVADLNVAGTMYASWFNKIGYDRYPNVKAWHERVFNRPGAIAARKLRET